MTPRPFNANNSHFYYLSKILSTCTPCQFQSILPRSLFVFFHIYSFYIYSPHVALGVIFSNTILSVPALYVQWIYIFVFCVFLISDWKISEFLFVQATSLLMTQCRWWVMEMAQSTSGLSHASCQRSHLQNYTIVVFSLLKAEPLRTVAICKAK